MKGDAYAPGVIAMAESIRMARSLVGIPADIVCMCTPDVSEVARAAIATVARVHMIEYIQYETKRMKTNRQMELYGAWLSQAYTKWRCLELTEYKKVLFVDADMLVVNNIDHLFALQAPAGTFSTPWAREYAPESTFNLRGYPREHGAVVPAQTILDTFKRGNGYTMIASMVLLEPNETVFRSLCGMVDEQQPFGHNNWSTPDEQSVTLHYAKLGQNWTMIHQKYNFIVHKINWLRQHRGKETTVTVPHVLHYFSSKKPWHMTSEFQASEFNTDKVWWYVMRQWWLRERRDLLKPDGKPLDRWEEMKSAEKITLRRTPLDDEMFPWLGVLRRPFPRLF
jgi:lipopolysaccharide biosynthesis glycosyltransferase